MNRQVMLRFGLSCLATLMVLGAGPVSASNGSNAGAAWNMAVVGHTDLGGRGFNADVWVHAGYAYVGQ